MTKLAGLTAMLMLQFANFWSPLPAALKTTLNSVTTPPPLPAPAAAASTPLPIQTSRQPLNLDAASAFAIDTATNTVLYDHNADAQQPIASLTKLVTALVITSRHPLTQMVTIPALPTYAPDDQTAPIRTGETYSERDLLTAMLVNSDDNVADALAIADAGSIATFAGRMNATMAEWGITDTHFSNPSGLTDTKNYATATALAKIAQLALANPFIRQTVAEQSATITSEAGRTITVTTTDDLLASGDFYGIKTGYTLKAGECFVGLTHINGHEVITVVLGADDRFAATTALTTWIGQNWTWY